MSINWPKPGPGFVSEYQSAGHIFVHAGSANAVTLKFLAKSITPIASADITFIDSEGNNNQLTGVPAGTRIEGKFIKFICDVGAFVEVTNIPADSYFHPAASAMVE